MKQTEIDYIELPGNIVQIVAVRGASDYCGISQEIGLEAYRKYLGNYPRYLRNVITNTGGVVVFDASGHDSRIEPGDKIQKSEFSDIVSAMRAAGERLGRIRKEAEAAKVKTVKI